jgi:ABC-type transport system involved in multi-copper enzyme maturation permease subunit
MIAKELREAKWKVLPGLLIPLFIALNLVFTSPADIDATYVAHRLHNLSAVASQPVSAYDSAVWIFSFTLNTGFAFMLLVLAAALGAGLIASETSRGSMFFLLSRPVSRDRLLLTKYAVCAALLLGLVVLIGLAALVVPAAYGHPQHPGGVVISIILFWLETLFVLGVALVCSVVIRGTLLAMIVALVSVFLMSDLPTYLYNLAQDFGWSTITHNSVVALSLGTYWSNLDAFAGNSFPWQSLLVSVIVAAIPVIVALVLFRRRAY